MEEKMNNSIYQTVLDSILSLNIPNWNEIVFYAQYDKDSYEMKFYVKHDGKFEDCFSLGIPTNVIVDVFIKLDKEVYKAREQLLKENHELWNVMTIIFDSDMHFRTEFDYSKVEDSVSYKSEWKKKKLN